MPSEKRARQRAQRDAKLTQVQRRRKRVRRLRQGASALVVAGLVVLVIVLVSQPSKPKKAASPTTTTTTSTTTTLAQAAVAPTCPPATAAGAAERETKFTHEPPICISRGVTYDATVATDVGTFVIELLPSAQLRAVNNFVFLARYHFFNGIIFQRVIPRFIVQGGDPTGTGEGGPGYEWTGNKPSTSCEAASDCYAPYDVAYANSGSTTTNGSQFFIVLPGGQADLAPSYTLFGKVISGFAAVNRIAADGTTSGTPTVTHHMVSVTISTAG